MKPRPEFVTHDRKKWEHGDGLVLHGDRRADPMKRTTLSKHGEHEDARTSRLVALVAGTYDGRQRRSTPKRWLASSGLEGSAALPIWDASQDARNRATVRKVYGEQLPTPYLPEELATRHARHFERGTTDGERVALEVLAIIDDYEMMSKYAEALEVIAPEYRKAITKLLNRSYRLADEAHPANIAKRTRPSTMKRPSRISRAHDLALTLADDVAYYAMRAGRNASQAVGARRAKETEGKAYEERATGSLMNPQGLPPPKGTVNYSTWHQLNVAYPARPVAHSGRCGRSRSATMNGKVPRYLSRMITDPERRLFARTARGTRALVVVDLSGSMSLTAPDIEAVLSASVGATVVGYSANDDRRNNCFVLAHRGTRVREVVRTSSGNGVDAPAFVWACRQFANSRTPILWVTDCEAVGRHGQTWENLDECRKVAKHYGARIETDVPGALEALHDLARGRRRPANPSRYSDIIEAKGHKPE